MGSSAGLKSFADGLYTAAFIFVAGRNSNGVADEIIAAWRAVYCPSVGP